MNRKTITRIDVLTFTGTRKGMTGDQRATLIRLLNDYRPEVLCNGCAQGADQQCLEVLVAMKLPIRIECWPSSRQQQLEARAILMKYGQPVAYHPVMSPLKRNTLMLDIPADLLIATPSGMAEEAGGGTWDTVRKAAKLRVRTVVIWPTGACHAGFKPAHAAR